LTWTAPDSDGGSPVTGYEYSTGGGLWSAIPGSTGLTSSHTFTGLANGTSYTYEIRAVNAKGNSGPSNSATATPCTEPDAPTGLTATTGGGNGQVVLTWTAPTDNGGSPITDYQISADGGVTWDTINSIATSFTIDGLTNGTSYDFAVRAVNANGAGAPSATVTATPTPVLSPPAISTTTLPDATTGSSYNQTLAATGYPTPTWAITSGALPPGLSLNPVTGTLTGTPTERGTYTFTVTAANGIAPNATQALTLSVDVPTTPAYQVVYDFGVWSGQGPATAYVSADYDKFFQLVYPDLTPVPTAYYTTAPGSTYIILTEAYLQTLPDGLYYYIAEYTDGDTRLIWLQIDHNGTSGNGNDSGTIPATSDNPWLPLSATACLLAGVVCLVVGVRTYRSSRFKPF
jgi:titin